MFLCNARSNTVLEHEDADVQFFRTLFNVDVEKSILMLVCLARC